MSKISKIMNYKTKMLVKEYGDSFESYIDTKSDLVSILIRDDWAVTPETNFQVFRN